MVYAVVVAGILLALVVLVLSLRGGMVPDESLCMEALGEHRHCESRMKRVRSLGWISSGAQLFRCGRGHAWILRPALFGWTMARWSNEDCSPGAAPEVSAVVVPDLHDPVGSMR